MLHRSGSWKNKNQGVIVIKNIEMHIYFATIKKRIANAQQAVI